MRRGIGITVLLAVANFWSVSGCGSAEDEDFAGAEALRLSAAGWGSAGTSSAGMTGSAGTSGSCDPYLCQQFSWSNISGTPCSCPERGICRGFLRNDQPLAPHTYFCRSN